MVGRGNYGSQCHTVADTVDGWQADNDVRLGLSCVNAEDVERFGRPSWTHRSTDREEAPGRRSLILMYPIVAGYLILFN